MTTITIHVHEVVPTYKTFKTRPPKLLGCETLDYEKKFMSHDYEQAHYYMRDFINNCINRADSDVNYSFRYQIVNTRKQ